MAGWGIAGLIHVLIAGLFFLGIHATANHIKISLVAVRFIKDQPRPPVNSSIIPKTFTPDPMAPVPLPVFEIAQAPRPANAITIAPPPVPPPPPPMPRTAITPDALAVACDTYLQTLRQHIMSFAQDTHMEGMVTLHFVLDGQAHLVTAEVAQSSGNLKLDKATLETLRAAEPLPQARDLTSGGLSVVMPILYRTKKSQAQPGVATCQLLTE